MIPHQQNALVRHGNPGPNTSITYCAQIQNNSASTSVFITMPLHKTVVSPLLISQWPRDAIWGYRSGSTMNQVMACCLTATSHYLIQCWLAIRGVLRNSPPSNFMRNAQGMDLSNALENHSFKITSIPPRDCELSNGNKPFPSRSKPLVSREDEYIIGWEASLHRTINSINICQKISEVMVIKLQPLLLSWFNFNPSK